MLLASLPRHPERIWSQDKVSTAVNSEAPRIMKTSRFIQRPNQIPFYVLGLLSQPSWYRRASCAFLQLCTVLEYCHYSNMVYLVCFCFASCQVKGLSFKVQHFYSFFVLSVQYSSNPVLVPLASFNQSRLHILFFYSFRLFVFLAFANGILIEIPR